MRGYMCSLSGKRRGHLKSLEAIATLGLLTDHIQHGIDEFRPFSVMSLCPVISCPRLSEDEIVGTEELAERTGTDL